MEQAISYLAVLRAVRSTPDCAELTVEHRPTGYTAVVRVTPETRLVCKRQVELEQLSDGQRVKAYGSMDPERHELRLIAADCVTPWLDDFAPTWPNKDFLIGELQAVSLASPEEHNRFCGLKNHFRYALRAQGVYWRILTDDDRCFQRPNLYEYRLCGMDELREGIELYVRYIPGDLPWLEAAELHDFFPAEFPYYRNRPGSASGRTPEWLRDHADAMRQRQKRIARPLADLMPVHLRVEPGLALLGEETVTAEFEARCDRKPNPDAEVFCDLLGTPRRVPVVLDWIAEPCGDRVLYRAKAVLPCGSAGQYRLKWLCDIGGDIVEYERSYAVITQTHAVVISHVMSGEPSPTEFMHAKGLPFTEWKQEPFRMEQWCAEANPVRWANVSHNWRQYGDDPAFWLDYAPGQPFMVREDSPEVQREALRLLHELPVLFGFDPPDNFGHYTVGTQTVEEARALGFHTLSGLCTENATDGHWAINHFGKPERPYFVGEDDFRKTGPGGERGIVGFSQTQRHTLLARSFFCDFNLEPGNGGLLFGAGGRALHDDLYLSRLLDFFEAMLQNRRSQTSPYFIQLGIEFGGNRPGATEGNERMLRYAIQKAATEPLVFSDVSAVSAFYRRHFLRTPQTVCYLPDFWAGMSIWDKPLDCGDTMTVEGQDYMALFSDGHALPALLYDYTRPWDYPDFGNETLPRRRDEFGYLDPEAHDPYAVTPSIEDLRGCRVEVEGSYPVVTVTVEQPEDTHPSSGVLPVALWSLPAEWLPGEGWFDSEGGRFLPVRAPYTGNLCGILEVPIQAGKVVCRLTLRSPKRTPDTQDILSPDGLTRAKVFDRDGQSLAYLWPTRPHEVHFLLSVPDGCDAAYCPAPDGILQALAPGEHTLTLPSGGWARLIGLNSDELQAALR